MILFELECKFAKVANVLDCRYWRSNLPRLEEIKLKVDPTDVFSNPQSVRPKGSPPDPPPVVLKRKGLIGKFC